MDILMADNIKESSTKTRREKYLSIEKIATENN